MNLLWKTSRRGDLWIDEQGLIDLIRQKLPEAAACKGVTLLREEDRVEVRVAPPSGDDIDDGAIRGLSRSVEDLLAPLGLKAELVVVQPEPESSSTCGRLVGNPLCWAATGATATAVVLLGAAETAIVCAVGLAFYGVSWLFLSPRGKDMLRSLLQK